MNGIPFSPITGIIADLFPKNCRIFSVVYLLLNLIF